MSHKRSSDWKNLGRVTGGPCDICGAESRWMATASGVLRAAGIVLMHACSDCAKLLHPRHVGEIMRRRRASQ